ncbi:hypothetical protein U879_21255 [Defluviimonas sp. 20V17]|uniref:Anti-sigma-K factor RskA n=1 Tax=Allgaiera indica TaxID=765699 RepID=A0AAN4UTG0_9RHOB|nr:anti-sigma factor [Allgaiera indica]KDB01669.1 hypothetical protein U879_21255 [Defluviimonas sp. 20V17]GHE03938.1 anti-sigma K factor RskA [Allgaiera indica]SDX35354.1 Anti-sigma-K factor RskA [Allgaiera indica]
MSTLPPPLPEDGDDFLAAEYVLGVLSLPERLAVESRLRREPAFAEKVAGWAAHLAPLDAEYPEEPAPDLMPAIEARIFGRPEPVAKRLPRRRWFLAALGATAAVAAFGVYLTGLDTTPQALTARIAAADGALIFQARYDTDQNVVTITRTRGPGPAAAHDYELWIITPGNPPAPVGLVSAATRKLTVPKLSAGDTLAVSLEPAGGSPNGRPTRVLGAGVLSLT